MPIYLDYNASTPIAPEVADVMRDAIDAMRFKGWSQLAGLQLSTRDSHLPADGR